MVASSKVLREKLLLLSYKALCQTPSAFRLFHVAGHSLEEDMTAVCQALMAFKVSFHCSYMLHMPCMAP